ncbi:MAG: PilZ domain-containing protein [Bryobacteraceae bacterium]|nr:PilZ domain-containing protein [Bryobacteraceae bacterium]MDW8379045.1 PilZ domain-containing protein [Bryobacterales bacterium]
MNWIDQRRNPRFELRLPFELVRTGSTQVGLRGETINLSASGVLFTLDTAIEVGESIEFVITLPTEARLRCVGKVVRKDDRLSRGQQCGGSVAATVERFEFVRMKNP